jgi:hypothetical protein
LIRRDISRPNTIGVSVALAVAGTVSGLVWWSTGNVFSCLLLLAFPGLYILCGIAVRQSQHGRRLAVIVYLCVVAFVGLAPVASALKIRHSFETSLSARHPSIADAHELLNIAAVPRGSAVISEDELLNYVMVKQPDRFSRVQSVQSLNVLSPDQRRRQLAAANYIYVSKRPNYGWNYLFYFPRLHWRKDPLRLALVEMMQSNQPRRFLGMTFSPVYNSTTGFAAKILSE